MRSEEQPDVLHTLLARSNWAAAPLARMNYYEADDALVAELVPTDPVTAVGVGEQLLVEFDGRDPGAQPTTVYLTGLLSHPDTADVAQARVVLGERLWGIAERLAADGGGEVEVRLDDKERSARDMHWAGLLARLGSLGPSVEPVLADGQPERIIGVELVPGRIRAVVTNGEPIVLEEVVIDLAGNEPDDVVAGVEQAILALDNRSSGAGVDRCPLGIQLGGPVVSTSGLVKFYDKPRLNSDDLPWFDVPLGDLLAEHTGRRVLVVNDAQAFAAHEIATSVEDSEFPDAELSVALLLVRQGVGAKLIRNGQVESFPMEIGVFMPDRSDLSIDSDEFPNDATIEAESGLRAIVDAVGATMRSSYDSIEDAADAADHDAAAAEPFKRAGLNLARAVAAVQAVVDPDQWVVYAPACLLDRSRPAGWAFVNGLEQAPKLLSYGGLGPLRSTRWHAITGSMGALAAAMAVARRARGRLD